MNCPCFERLKSAGSIAASEDIYTIAFAPKHKTLAVGDRVVMREDASYNNMFVRLKDLTLHDLQSDEQYVLVVKNDEVL